MGRKLVLPQSNFRFQLDGRQRRLAKLLMDGATSQSMCMILNLISGYFVKKIQMFHSAWKIKTKNIPKVQNDTE